MTELRVLGIGSPFGDDQLGWAVLKQLQQKVILDPYIPSRLELMCMDRPGLHLLELMRGAQSVFLIDAVQSDTEIGTIQRLENGDINGMSHHFSTHALGVAEAMVMGSILQELPEQVVLYGINIGHVPCEFSLSEPIVHAIDVLVAQLENDILASLRARRMIDGVSDEHG